MAFYSTLLGGLWIIFILVWLIAAFNTKRTLRRGWVGMWWRIGFIVAVVLLLHYRLLQAPSYLGSVIHVPVLNIVGLVLVTCGIALAIWARIYLGRNWGMPMAVKENPELVTSGPYHWIRNPIYTGILLATLGSAFIDWWWGILLVWSVIYCVIAVHGEEKLLLKQFPDQYPAYKARTWALVPWVW